MFSENYLIHQHAGEIPRSGNGPESGSKPRSPTEKEKAGSPDDGKTDIAGRLSEDMTKALPKDPGSAIKFYTPAIKSSVPGFPQKPPTPSTPSAPSTPAGPQEPPTPNPPAEPAEKFELPTSVEEYRITAFRNSLSLLSRELKRKITYFPNLTEKQLKAIREKFDILKQYSAVIDSFDPEKTIQLHLVGPSPLDPVKLEYSRGTLKISIDLLASPSIINPALRENLIIAKFYLLKNYLRKEFGIKHLTEVEDGVYDRDFYGQLDKVRDAFNMLTPKEQDKLKQFNVALKGNYSAHWDEGYVKNDNGDPFIVIDPSETKEEITEDIQDAIKEAGR